MDGWSYKISGKSCLSELEVFGDKRLILFDFDRAQFYQLQEKKNSRIRPNQKGMNRAGLCKFWVLQ